MFFEIALKGFFVFSGVFFFSTHLLLIGIRKTLTKVKLGSHGGNSRTSFVHTGVGSNFLPLGASCWLPPCLQKLTQGCGEPPQNTPSGRQGAQGHSQECVP